MTKKINEKEDIESASDGDEEIKLRAMMLDEGPPVDGKYKKLMEMGFMKRAADQQREQARAEAMNVLRELQTMDESDHESGDEGKSDEPVVSSERLKEATTNINKMMNERPSSILNLAGSSSSVRVNGAVNIASKAADALAENTTNPWIATNASQSRKRRKESDDLKLYANIDSLLESNEEGLENLEKAELPPQTRTAQSRKRLRASSNTPVAEGEVSLDGTSFNFAGVQEPGRKTTENTSNGVLDSSAKQMKDSATPPNKNKSIKKPERKPLLLQRSQEDLVQMAFAGPDFEKDFEEIKQKAVDEELEIDEKRLQINAQGMLLCII